LQVRYPHPRRAHARRSCERAFVHRKNRFSPANVRTATQERGRKPPVATLHGSTTTENHGKPALVQQSPLCGTAGRHCTEVREHTTGGLRRLCGTVPASALPTPTAGSRPPLLRTCVRASQKSFFAGKRSLCNTRAGGVSPPVEAKRRCKSQPRISDDMRAFTKSGGRKPPVFSLDANATAIGTRTLGGLPNNRACVCATSFPHPRRADARRSCERAFVHRKNRFSPANVRAAIQERGA